VRFAPRSINQFDPFRHAAQWSVEKLKKTFTDQVNVRKISKEIAT